MLLNKLALQTLLLAALIGAGEAAAGDFKIISYNVLYGFNHHQSQELGAGWLAGQDPDVVALQELNGWTQETLGQLARAWGHPHVALLKEDGFPVGLTSREPIEVLGRHLEEMHHGWLHCRTSGSHFLVVHLSPFKYQHRQLEAAAITAKVAELRADGASVVVLGDFNAHSPLDRKQLDRSTGLLEKRRTGDAEHAHVQNLNDGQFDFSVMQAFLDVGLEDSCRKQISEATTKYGTIPSRISGRTAAEQQDDLSRIDFILLSEDLAGSVTSSAMPHTDVLLNQVSDHIPVIVTLKRDREPGRPETLVRFGLIADVHQDVMHDASERIAAFGKAMQTQQADFVCQLGDFCQPKPANRDFLETWNSIELPRHHVLGNHEMDGATREQAVAFLDMPSRYYSFDTKGIHVVVLDGNDPGGVAGGYPRFVGAGQLEWLANDLAVSKLPAVVFSHQPLDEMTDGGVENRAEVRTVLEAARTKAGQTKVIICFAGHHHDDRAARINGIHYVRVNSASYVWLPAAQKRHSYSEEIHQKFPVIERVAPYRDPLWAVIDIDTAARTITVTGRETTWVGLSPEQRSADTGSYDPRFVAPRITGRDLRFWEEE